MSWADGGAAIVATALSGIIPVLLQAGGLFPALGVAMIVCGIPFGLLVFVRGLKQDIRALDDPNDNPRANQLIAGRPDHDHHDAKIALLCALLLLTLLAAAFLYGRYDH
jgi:hypothetical protein